jgi:hypothetical protein
MKHAVLFAKKEAELNSHIENGGIWRNFGSTSIDASSVKQYAAEFCSTEDLR